MNQQSTIDLNSLWHVVTSNLSVLSATRRWRSLLLRLPCMLSGIQIAGAPGFVKSKSFKAAYRTPVELLENVWTCWTLSANILLILGLLNMFIRDHQSMQLRWFLGRPSFVACRQPKHRPVGHQEIHCPNTMNMRQFFFVFFFPGMSTAQKSPQIDPNWVSIPWNRLIFWGDGPWCPSASSAAQNTLLDVLDNSGWVQHRPGLRVVCWSRKGASFMCFLCEAICMACMVLLSRLLGTVTWGLILDPICSCCEAIRGYCLDLFIRNAMLQV